MSHHLDSPLARADVRLDITDLYVFAGQSGTVFVMNVCTSLAGDIPTPGFHPEALYEFKIDIDDDAVEDLTLRFRFDDRDGTVTLIEKCSGAVGFEAVATEHRWVVHISGGSVGRGDLTPDREAVGHLGSPLGRAEQIPSRPEVCGDAAEGGQEPLGMPRRFEAFHRPFALSGGLMRVLGAVVQIPRPPVLHRRHALAVGDLVAAQLVGDQHARHVPQALEQLAEEPLGRHRVSA
jgi:Domain of unknown function (DUF4331)